MRNKIINLFEQASRDLDYELSDYDEPSTNVEVVEEELDEALFGCYDVPMQFIAKIASSILDKAELEGRLNSHERVEVYNYLTECYGYVF